MREKRFGKAREFVLEDAHDAWLLSKIVQPGDEVRAETTRKVQLGKEQVRKRFILTLRVTSVGFDGERLVIRGRTLEEREEIPKGSVHTFRLAPGAWLRIVKPDWHEADELLARASAGKRKVLLALFDDKQLTLATFAFGRIKPLGVLRFHGGKRDADTLTFLDEIRTVLAEREKEYDVIILGGPAFWLESMPARWKRIPTSSAHLASWREFLRREDVRAALQGIDAAEEAMLFDEARERLAKNLLAYGLGDVKHALELGAVSVLVLSKRFVHDTPPETLETLYTLARDTRARVHIIQADEEFDHFVQKLGGILAFLRYAIS